MHAVKTLTDDKIILFIQILTIEFKPENYLFDYCKWWKFLCVNKTVYIRKYSEPNHTPLCNLTAAGH